MFVATRYGHNEVPLNPEFTGSVFSKLGFTKSKYSTTRGHFWFVNVTAWRWAAWRWTLHNVEDITAQWWGFSKICSVILFTYGHKTSRLWKKPLADTLNSSILLPNIRDCIMLNVSLHNVEVFLKFVKWCYSRLVTKRVTRRQKILAGTFDPLILLPEIGTLHNDQDITAQW